MSIQRSLPSAQPADRWFDCRCRRESPTITRDRSPLQFGGFVAMLPDSAKKSAKSYRKSFCPRRRLRRPCHWWNALGVYLSLIRRLGLASFFKFASCSFGFPFCLKGDPQVVMGVGIFWTQRYRLLVLADGSIRILFSHECISENNVSIRFIRL